jgi:hypothetical protein
MNWLHVLLAFVGSAVRSTFTDWYFFGVLFHQRYGNTPGVWRKYKDKKDETTSIAVSEGIMSVTSLVFIPACAHLGLVRLIPALLAAGALWIMIPVPLLVTNAIFIPMDRWMVVSHSLGWLARLITTALCVSWLL